MKSNVEVEDKLDDKFSEIKEVVSLVNQLGVNSYEFYVAAMIWVRATIIDNRIYCWALSLHTFFVDHFLARCVNEPPRTNNKWTITFSYL